MQERTIQPLTVKHAICRNFFYYLPEEPASQVKQKNSKALITPSADWLAAFTGDYCLQIHFPLYPPEQTHPEQGMVEIYDHTSHDRSDALMELEYHGPYKTLQPGEHFTNMGTMDSYTNTRGKINRIIRSGSWRRL